MKVKYYCRQTRIVLLWKTNTPDRDLETNSPNYRPEQDPLISTGYRRQINSVVGEPTGCEVIADLVLVTKENSTVQYRRANYKNNTGMCD